MKTIFNGKIEYTNSEELSNLTKDMDNNLSLNILESAINCAISSGVYNLDECFILYNCLLKLKKNEINPISFDNTISNSNTDDK